MKTQFQLLFFSIGILCAIGISCNKSEPDPCENVLCGRDGQCVDGECVCDLGYQGPYCSAEIVPSVMYLDSVLVKEIPYEENWDPGTGPDVYLQLKYNGQIIWKSEIFVEDMNSYDYFLVKPQKRVALSDPEAEYEIRLMDYDVSGGDDFMDSLLFVPYLPTKDFPKKLSFLARPFDANIFVSYEWE